MKKFILFSIFTFIFAFDSSYMKACKFFNKGLSLVNSNYNQSQLYFKKAFDLLSNYKKKYNPKLHYMLGMMYLNGWGVEQNYKKALKELVTAEKFGNKRVHCPLLKVYTKTNDIKNAKKELKYVLMEKNSNCKIAENILKEIK